VRRISLSLCVLVAAGVVAGCGSVRSSTESKALALWSHFPVNDSERPIVVSPDYGEVLAPDAGFPTVNAKLAFASARFELATKLPPSPARSDGYPITDATRAIKLLRDSGGSVGGAGGSPLRITRVSLGAAPFLTDRGWQRLPAWRIHLAGVSTPAAVLAVRTSEIFTQPRLLRATHREFDSYPDEASVSAGGKTLTIRFVGGHSGNNACDDSYTATVAESAEAVAVRLHQHPAPAPADTACSLVGCGRTVTVQLAHRLGPRVLVDAANGGIMPVYPAGTGLPRLPS
jgi:hypothetical protein